ncbi:MAG: RluA family pseudouridine synthase [Lachnospiraceae bacterium]|nr:RluA family pseudouridine synthase [Lachnospiraceae bacterium]
MKEFIIKDTDEGLRLDKQLLKILNKAGSGFIYKMLRKKNITLNGKKALGSEHLKAGDVIRIYLSEDTFEKFSGSGILKSDINARFKDISDWIIFEDDNIMLINKPAGVLSQKAKDTDFSLNEMCLFHMIDNNELNEEKLKLFTPSICNRLDRNTSGLIIFGKTYSAASVLGEALRLRTIKKYYLCIVKGQVSTPGLINGYLIKNETENKVTVKNEFVNGSQKVSLSYKPLKGSLKYTLLEVDLITGKSHQIRALMAYKGHPLLADPKYGDKILNKELIKEYGVEQQLLHSFRLVMPKDLQGGMKDLKEREFIADTPWYFEPFMKQMNIIYNGEGLCRHGTAGDFGDQRLKT